MPVEKPWASVDAAARDAVPELVGGQQVAHALNGDGGVEEAEAAAQHRLVALPRRQANPTRGLKLFLSVLMRVLGRPTSLAEHGAVERDDAGRQQGRDLRVRHDVVSAVVEDEVRELVVLLVPDADDLVAEAEEEGQAAS